MVQINHLPGKNTKLGLIMRDHVFVISDQVTKTKGPVPEVIKHFSCSTLQSMKSIRLINVKMPTTVGILTFMSKIIDFLL